MQKEERANLLNKYRIFETAEFAERLGKILPDQQKRMTDKIRTYVYPQLREQPYYGRNIKKLKDYDPETWRYRIGDYRFFYEIDATKKVVYMVSADHRGEAYR